MMMELFAWLEVEPNGDEGQIVTMVPSIGISGPLQSRNRKVAEKLRPIAEKHQKDTGRPVRLAYFVRADTFEELS